MNFLVSLFFLSTAVTAFHVQPRAVGRTRLVIEATKEGKDIDVSRAKECAENFGQCSVEEIKDLRDELHKERIQNMIVAENPSTPPSAGMLDHEIIEQELDLQLNLLQAETPDSSLFPEDEDEMAALPHLKDQPKHKENPVSKKTEDFVHSAEVAAMETETMVDEETMETAMICLAIAALVFLPQLFRV